MGWLRAHVRLEDVLLFAWLIIGPILLPPTRPAASGGVDLLGGFLDIVALCLAGACVGVRTRDGTSTGLLESGNVAYAVGPLVGAVLFALDDTSEKLGLNDSLLLLPIVLAVAAAIAARRLVAPVTIGVRRALVTPFVLLTSTFFSGFIAGFTDLFNLRVLWPSVENGQAGEVLVVLAFATAATAVFYVMFVFAPRQIAEREGSGAQWLVRFVVFLVGLMLSATVTAARVSP